MAATSNARPDRVPGRRLTTTTFNGTVVTVRQWEPGDLDSYHAAMHESFEHLTPWMPWAAAEPQEFEAHEALINRWSGAWDFDDFVYGMFIGPDDLVVGGCGLHNRVGPTGWEIGYWVHPDHEGRGIVSASVRALTDEAFIDPTIEGVEIRCDEANVRSANVPKRLGYAFVGEEKRAPVAPAETETTHVYRIDRATWVGDGQTLASE